MFTLAKLNTSYEGKAISGSWSHPDGGPIPLVPIRTTGGLQRPATVFTPTPPSLSSRFHPISPSQGKHFPTVSFFPDFTVCFAYNTPTSATSTRVKGPAGCRPPPASGCAPKGAGQVFQGVSKDLQAWLNRSKPG